MGVMLLLPIVDLTKVLLVVEVLLSLDNEVQGQRGVIQVVLVVLE